jgi:hypothetical protein
LVKDGFVDVPLATVEPPCPGRMRIDRARRRLIDTIGFSGRKVWQSCKDHGYANSLLYFSKVGATRMKRIQLICYRFRYVLCGLEFLFGLIWLVTVHVVRANPDHRTSQYPESMGLSMSGVPTFMSMSQAHLDGCLVRRSLNHWPSRPSLCGRNIQKHVKAPLVARQSIGSYASLKRQEPSEVSLVVPR